MQMSRFYITNENTEDTFDATDDLQEAIRMAREVARQGEAGDLVSIEHNGKNIRQTELMPNGEVAETALA
jgi:hypothetical protein